MAKTRKEVKQDSPPEDDFGALFQHYLLRRTERLLDQVAADDQLLDEEVRSKALAALEFALESQDAHAVAGKLLLAMAPKMERAGFRDEWISYLEKGIHTCKAANDLQLEAELLYQTGFLYQLRAKYEASEKYLQQSIIFFADLKLVESEVRSLFRLAFVNRLQRNYLKARQNIEKGFSLVPPNHPVCAHGYYLRGLLAYDDNAYASAIEEYQRSVELYQKTANMQMVAQRLGNIGSAYSGWGKYHEAISYYNQSLGMFEQQQDITRIAVMKMNIGNVHLRLKEPNNAITLYEQADSIFRSTNDELHLALLHLNYGIAYRLRKDWQQSKKYLLNAIERWQILGDIQSLVNTIDELGILYLEQGMTHKAKVTFTQALENLKQIELQPGYGKLLERVTQHLAQLRA